MLVKTSKWLTISAGDGRPRLTIALDGFGMEPKPRVNMTINNEMLDCQVCGRQVDINEMYSPDACSEECQTFIFAGIWLGQKVKATNNGEKWFVGVYEKNSDVFAQYGVRLDTGELRYFIQIAPTTAV